MQIILFVVELACFSLLRVSQGESLLLGGFGTGGDPLSCCFPFTKMHIFIASRWIGATERFTASGI